MNLVDVYAIQDITIAKALGSYVWDNHGQKYLDMYGGHAVISIGHSHPQWIKRIQDQMAAVSFYSNSVKIPIQEELAAMLGQVCGKSNFNLFLCNSGAEANENALKLASFYNGKKEIIAFSGGFHGRTSLAVAATDYPQYRAPVNNTDHVTILPFNDVQALESHFAKQGDQISSVIVEGIQGVGGIHEASIDFLQAVRRLCDQYEAIYIADSVQCGYGRTGIFFSHDYAGINADIYTMAKGMGNGFPVAGIIVAPHVKASKGQLGTTFGGNHLACAAALAVLEVMDRDNLIQKASEVGQYIKEQLSNTQGILHVRGRGLMIGFEMTPELAALRNRLLSNQHIFTGSAMPNTIRLLPSMSLTMSEADIFIDRLRAEINSIV